MIKADIHYGEGHYKTALKNKGNPWLRPDEIPRLDPMAVFSGFHNRQRLHSGAAGSAAAGRKKRRDQDHVQCFIQRGV